MVPLAGPPSKSPTLRAGAAAVDITPKVFPLNMPGLFTTRMAESAHDPLHARALVLDDGATTLALVVVDNIGVAQETSDEAKAIASKRCGIAVDKILVASTHTHTAPESNPQRPDARRRVSQAPGRGDRGVHRPRRTPRCVPPPSALPRSPLAEEVFNRRWFLKPGKMPLNPFGQLDKVKMNPTRIPTFSTVPPARRIRTSPSSRCRTRSRASRCALLANYSLHYVGHVPEGMVSADYFGEFARLMHVARRRRRLRRHDVQRHLRRHQQQGFHRKTAAARAVRADPNRRAEGRRHRVARACDASTRIAGRALGHDPARGDVETASPHSRADRAGGSRAGHQGRGRTRQASASGRRVRAPHAFAGRSSRRP